MLVSQLGVFICLQIGRLGMRGIKRVKERDWKSERGKDRERVGRREGSGWNPDVSQFPEWEREREGERDRALRYHSLLEWIPPLHIQHTHTYTQTLAHPAQRHICLEIYFFSSHHLWVLLLFLLMFALTRSWCCWWCVHVGVMLLCASHESSLE